MQVLLNLFLQNAAAGKVVAVMKEQTETAGASGVEPLNAVIAAGVALAAGAVIYIVRHGGMN